VQYVRACDAFGGCEVIAMDFDQMVEQYHQALDEFTKANPKPMTALFSQRDGVSLAGGFGGVTRGFEQVKKNTEVAASQFREGQISFKTLEKYAREDLGYIVEIERYEAKLFGSEEIGLSIIRCTSIFRRENGIWNVVHRHGDPLPATRALAQAPAETVVSIQKAV
jgi:ketosteroid isomerase-like protein